MESRNNKGLHIAKWWETTKNNKILCTLCPRYCTIGEGQNGFCYVRKNIEGVLYTLAYNRPTGFAVDPIEKKPLNHFLPGSSILSFGTAGCNLGCKFCQNWTSTKAKIDGYHSVYASAEEIVSLAERENIPSIAFTYNDPVIFGEFVIDVSKLARERGIKTVMVTAGYIDRLARKEVFKNIDAANVDLKAFSEMFYHKLTLSHLKDVLETLLWLKRETNVWLEITTLLIPGENDSEEEIKQLSDWIVDNMGDGVPLHFTAFHPAFRMRDRRSTPTSTVKKGREIAMSRGIKYCYTGNIIDEEGQSTYCPECRREVIVRDWHSVKKNSLIGNRCKFCNAEIAGVFE